MKSLYPLTISRSTLGKPTVLLTADYDSYLLYAPITEQLRVGNHLHEFMLHHFKIRRLKTGAFSLSGKRYFCVEQHEGGFSMDPWQDFLWLTKRSFNQFLRPRTFFEVMLFDLFFPVWESKSEVQVVMNKKFLFAVSPLLKSDYQQVKFHPFSLTQLGLNHAEYKRFLTYFKQELSQVLEEFLVLHHEKFMIDLKYQLSLYPDLRNTYWDELKKCFDPVFKQFVEAQVRDYIYRL